MKKKLTVRYKYILSNDGQRKLDEVFDMIFSKIEEAKSKEKSTLDKVILEDYTVFRCKNG